jgi:tetratricopeptide (TPR) repeat protein
MDLRNRLVYLPVIVVIVVLLKELLLPSGAVCQTSSRSTGIQSLYISGFVRDDESHQSLKAVTVTLTRGSGGANVAPSVVSGTAGEFQFSEVLSGDYRIEVNQKGYQPASVAVMLGGTPLANVIVSLRPEKESRAFEDLAVSTHQLSAPDKAREAFIKGVKLLTASKPDYNRALVQFQRAIDSFPTYYEAYAEMGIAYYHLGQSDNAEQALRKSMSLSSNQYPDAIFLLSEMLDDQNRFAEAEPIARDGIRLEETSWRSYLSLARALAGLKRAPEAEISATKASELKPDNAEIFLVLGNIHIQEHNYAGVIKDFDTFLKLEPTGPRSDLVRQSEAQARQALQKMQAQTNPSPAKP